MRLRALSVAGVGGLADGRIPLPEDPLVAFAGANGTGKSKLLACLLSPWSRMLPSATTGARAEVSVELRLSTAERAALGNLSVAAGWGEVDVPEDVALTTRLEPMVGIQSSAEPPLTVLSQMATMQEFLQGEPTLNIVYLPAERRLLPPGQAGIDLNQLSDLISWQKTAEPRSAVQNYGRLDDQEFEQFAKALCVADTLPDEADSGTSAPETRIRWPEFVETVNALIAPKRLLPLTRQHPEQLRIRTQAGGTHAVQDLSSGERQALIIISRVLRAGGDNRVVLIDEPDAYLHPHLSRRLIQALELGAGEAGQLVVATHSPAILDNLAPSAIVRLRHDELPRPVADETERVDFYRAAGFRASALTQSDLLLITEGESDVSLLASVFPQLTRATLRSAGGRARVLREVEQLRPYDLPVLGAVDRDVLADPVPEPLAQSIAVWPAADIEGVFLSDDAVLGRMVDLGLVKPEFSVQALKELLASLCDELKGNVVAEIAQRQLRATENRQWPSPRGATPIERLRETVREMAPLTSGEVDAALGEAEILWDSRATTRWTLVRGKYVLNAFAGQASEMRTGRGLLEAVARSRPNVAGFAAFEAQLRAVL